MVFDRSKAHLYQMNLEMYSMIAIPYTNIQHRIVLGRYRYSCTECSGGIGGQRNCLLLHQGILRWADDDIVNSPWPPGP
jgi:hypothetical protein